MRRSSALSRRWARCRASRRFRSATRSASRATTAAARRASSRTPISARRRCRCRPTSSRSTASACRTKCSTPRRCARALPGSSCPITICDKLLPAISAGRTVLLFGPPGNGKTTLATRVGKLFRDVIYVPYAVDVGRSDHEGLRPGPAQAAGDGGAGRVSRRRRRVPARALRRALGCLPPPGRGRRRRADDGHARPAIHRRTPNSTTRRCT